MDKILALIPAYNEEKNINQVILGVKKHIPKLLVIDDCSKDKTAEIAEKAGAIVIRKELNKGKGDSLKLGFDCAVKNKFDYLLVLDADGEHKPKEIPLFLSKMHDYDIVVGQRRQYRSFDRRLVNYFSNLWFRVLIPNIRDMYCGFRLINVGLLRKIKLESKGFELEAELLLEAVKHNARIGFVDVTTSPIEKSHFKVLDYIKTNNLYDRWIIRNIHGLRVNFFKKAFLLFFAVAGLLLFRWFE